MAHFPRKAKPPPPSPSFSSMQIAVDKTVIPGNLVDALMTLNQFPAVLKHLETSFLSYPSIYQPQSQFLFYLYK